MSFMSNHVIHVKSCHSTVVLKEGSADIRELEWVVNRKTQVPRVKLPENDESGFRFWVGGTQGTRRDPERFWVPKKPLF
jgi:hypothetical protein